MRAVAIEERTASSRRRDLEGRGLVSAGLAVVLFVPFVAGDVWLRPALYSALLMASSALGAFTQRRAVRLLALAVAALLWLPGVMYGLAMFPPVGVVMGIGAVMAGWGAVRAARGRKGVPGPLS